SSSVSSILSTVLFLPRFSLFVSFFFLQCYGDHRDLHSFPTRRSSDLGTLPVRKDHPHLNFCQLYGMGDDITFNLAAEGYNVAKYLPYGPVRDAFPYLVRRAEENRAMSNEFNREYELVKLEVERRNL